MPVSVGIDIAKKDFEARLLRDVTKKGGIGFNASNSSQGFASLVAWAKKEANGEEIIFCMESTGGYEFPLACHLVQAGERVSVENPRRIKHFAIALGMANKTDKADARAIAAYALATNPRPWALTDETRRHISQLGRHRDNLLGELCAVRNRLEHKGSLPQLIVKQLEAHKKLLETQIKTVETEQSKLAEKSEAFKGESEVVLKLYGIAEKTAFVLLSEMADVRLYDSAESWVAQAGTFPCRRESGQWKGQTRMSKSGNARVRKAMYMGTTVSMRFNPTIKAFAERLRDKGRKPKEIRIACMRKLLMLCYGVLKAHHEGRAPFYGFPPKKQLEALTI